MWKTLNPDPAVIRNAQWMRWHEYPQQLSAAWEQPVADWDGPAWMTVPGARLSSLTVSRTPKNFDNSKNQFEAMSEEGPVEDSEPPHKSGCGCRDACEGMKVNLADVIKMPSRNKLKAARRMKAFEESGEHAATQFDCCYDTGLLSLCQTMRSKMKPILKKKVKCIVKDGQVAVTSLCSASEPSYRDMIQNPKEKPAWPGLKVFVEKRPHSLRPLAGANEGEWEHLEAILDSGATVTVIPPHVGKEYEVVPSEASKAGVRYEVANGEEIPNLGEKLLPVVTDEGSWRGMLAQVADVSKALQSVRALVRSGHVVVFGDGDGGTERYVYNKTTGETNFVRDDGVNYLMSLHIAPRAEAGFGRPVTAR